MGAHNIVPKTDACPIRFKVIENIIGWDDIESKSIGNTYRNSSDGSCTDDAYTSHTIPTINDNDCTQP
jgi:hypothetical protein